MPPDEIGFADNHEVESRRGAINRFLEHVLDPEDGTWHFLSDEETIFDVWMVTGKDRGLLTSRIRQAYGVDLTPEELSQPLWRLVDLLEGPA